MKDYEYSESQKGIIVVPLLGWWYHVDLGYIVDILVILKLMWLADSYNTRLSVSGHDAFDMGDNKLLLVEWKYRH